MPSSENFSKTLVNAESSMLFQLWAYIEYSYQRARNLYNTFTYLTYKSVFATFSIRQHALAKLARCDRALSSHIDLLTVHLITLWHWLDPFTSVSLHAKGLSCTVCCQVWHW